jgi:RNA polymerase sigma-70 factor (ECF subfamily)
MRFIKSGRQSSMPDEEVISSYKKTKDPFYIGILFDRYSHLVFAVSMKYLKNEDDSKDVVLKIFEKLPADILNYQIQYFSSWLHTVTRNHCLRFIEQNKIYFLPGDDLPAPEEDDDLEKQLLPHLGPAIEKLNEEQRTCIQLFYIENLSYEEVSAKTGYSMKQVKSYIQNGKRNLKNILIKKTDDR